MNFLDKTRFRNWHNVFYGTQNKHISSYQMLCMLQWINNYCINRLFCNQSKNCSYCTHLCVFRPLSVCGPFPQTLVGRLVSLLLTNQSPLWQFHLHAANIRFNLYWKKDTARINNYNIFIPLQPLNLVFMPQCLHPVS